MPGAACPERLARQFAPKLHGSCCGRCADGVERLVSGARAYICDACVTECVAVREPHGGFGRLN